MTRKLLVILLVALVIPAAALAKSVGNAKLTVHSPTKVKSAWVGSAALATSKAEQLELQVCLQSSGKTITSSCNVAKGKKAVLVTKSKAEKASNERTWAWADVAGHTTTAVS